MRTQPPNLSLRNSPLYKICMFSLGCLCILYYINQVILQVFLCYFIFLPVVSSVLLPNFFILSATDYIWVVPSILIRIIYEAEHLHMFISCCVLWSVCCSLLSIFLFIGWLYIFWSLIFVNYMHYKYFLSSVACIFPSLWNLLMKLLLLLLSRFSSVQLCATP